MVKRMEEMVNKIQGRIDRLIGMFILSNKISNKIGSLIIKNEKFGFYS